jgi:hypothetical protein
MATETTDYGFASDIYDPMYGIGVHDTYEGIGLATSPRTPPVGFFPDPLTPEIVPYGEYPSGYGLLSPLGGEPSRIDWSTVSDISRGGGGAVGDIAVGHGGELMMGEDSGWHGMGSLYDTSFWTEDEDYGHLGFGALTPDSSTEYTPIPGPRDLTGGGWGYETPSPMPDYTEYVESYPDLGAAYTTYKDSGGLKFPTVDEYGEWHYDKYGSGEERTLPTYEAPHPDGWLPFAEAPPESEHWLMPIVEEMLEMPSLGVLGSIATGSPIESTPTGTLPPVAPPVEPVAETTPPMLPTEAVVDPYGPSLPPAVEPELEPLIGAPELYPLIEEASADSPSPLETSSGISGSPFTTAMAALSPSFAGGGGLLCDPVTGKCPTYR